MKTTAPLVAAWAEHMNGQLPEANKQVLHHVDADGNIVRDELPPEATDFCGNDGERCLRKVMIYLLTSCNTEERIAQNIYIHNSNRNIKKSTTRTILIKKRIGIGYKTRVLGIAFHSSYNLCLSVS